jgi:imidazolonepropionase-like amidohydrolase
MAFTASNSFVVKNVLLFTGHEFIQDGFVVVQDGKVTALGTGDPPNYDGIPTISKPGDTLLPGFIDSHIHALSGNTESIEQSLRFGVTTVCDMHNDHEHIAKLTKVSYPR